MAYVPDMTPWTYEPGEDFLTAIGWLERGHPYTKGATPDDVLSILDRIRERNLSIVWYMGIHECTLSQACAAGPSVPRSHVGASNLIVPAEDRIFVFPELITHYIRDHGYAPPEVFCEAVRRCPAPESDAYRAIAEQCSSRLAAEAVQR